mgnify:CR=1 FL=1
MVTDPRLVGRHALWIEGQSEAIADTGDVVREEVEIGTAAVTDTPGSSPRAKVEGSDRGIAKGCVMLRPLVFFAC